MAEGANLIIKAPGHNVQLKPASNTLFYWDEKVPMDVEFTKAGFVLRADQVQKFRRVK
ncbi:hypothetical protein MKQ70_10720 [Chitinophaga sedimenti]|uniref:hypothetical protein n=1 Tax=Chitinophaga sedimenti TaxID=2033606 RepID=UPI0020049985|nr:hypothetical protein [Chitinophaga sedimenti]MCK7555451.1 hypothetical protein [Chitinophaga sedimenti]